MAKPMKLMYKRFWQICTIERKIIRDIKFICEYRGIPVTTWDDSVNPIRVRFYSTFKDYVYIAEAVGFHVSHNREDYYP